MRISDITGFPGMLPIVAWGNGACRVDGTWFETPEMLVESIDWAIAENARRTS